MLFLAVKSRWIRSGDLIRSYIRGEQQGGEVMLSLKAPLFQGADLLLGEDGSEDTSQSPRSDNSSCVGGSTGSQHWE